MSIIFSVIAYDNNIIYKYAACDGNFVDIVCVVLSKIPLKNNKMTYLHGQYLFNYIVENGYVYFCVTDKTCQRSKAFLFLNEIKRSFIRNDEEDITRTLAAEMSRYSEDYNNIQIKDGDLDEINIIEVDSSESILGEKILEVKNEDNLEYSTISFVGRPAEKITISVESTNSYTIIGVTLILMVLVMYIFGPMLLIIIIGTFVLLYIRQKKIN